MRKNGVTLSEMVEKKNKSIISKIKSELQNTKKSLKEYREFDEKQDNEDIFVGWEEALTWVLSLYKGRK